jgi:cupin fold WbuC family metalloprotein
MIVAMNTRHIASDPQAQLITEDLFQEVRRRAEASPRRRMNHNFHASLDDILHRFLNVLLRGTYVPPHRHVDPPKPEAFVILEGQAAFFLFDDRGEVRRTVVLGKGAEGAAPVTWGIDIPPGAWHSLAALTPYAVCYEVKPGPYAPAGDKDFAPWAPRENQPEAAAYLETLLRQHVPQAAAD